MNTKVTIEEIKRRLKNKYNIEEDELEALGYKTDEAIRQYYQDVCLGSEQLDSGAEEDDATGKTPVDTYKLLPEYENTLKSLKSRKKAEDKFEAQVKEVKKKVEFAASQSSITPDARVSYEEAQQAMKDAVGTPKKRKAVRARKEKGNE